MMVVLMPLFVVPMLMVSMFMVLMPMAVFASLFVMVMMVFVYHGSVLFPEAKVRRPGCNRVAIFAGNAYLSGH
jgi:hypothetical protein